MSQETPPVIRVDAITQEVWVGDQPVWLSGSEFRLLTILAQRRGTVLDRRELSRLLFGKASSAPGLHVYICRLREKLGEEHEWITSIRGRGVRFTGSVEWVHQQPAGVEADVAAVAATLVEVLSRLAVLEQRTGIAGGA